MTNPRTPAASDDAEPNEIEDGADETPAPPPSGVHTLEAADTDAGQRLDRFLAAHLAGLSRARIQALIRSGNVESETGILADAATRVTPGQQIRIAVPEPTAAAPAGEPLPLTIVHEDKHLIVIDKPAGLVVHPAAGHAQGTLVNALIAHCGGELSGIGGVRRPGIVHRLDKDTSGLLVVAKTDAAHQRLAEQFASHGADGRLTRAYEAFVWGVPARSSGTIDANIGRSPTNRTRMAVARGEHGRRAVTHFEVLESFAGPDGKPLAARLRLMLETGRTHQIRVHLAHIGHPVMGDPAYGTGFKSSTRRLTERASEALNALDRQALHAEELGFEHPVTGRPLRFTSPRPSDMQALYDALKPSPDTQKRRKTKPHVSKR